MKKIFTLAIMTVMCVAAMAQEKLTIKIYTSSPVTFNSQQVQGNLKLDGVNTTVDMTIVSEPGSPNVYHYSIALNAGTYTASVGGTTSSGTAISGKNVYQPSFTLTSTQTVHFWGRVHSKGYVEGLCSALQYGVMDGSWQYYAMGKPSYGNTKATGYFFTPDAISYSSLKGGVSTKVLGDDILTNSATGVLPVTFLGDSYTQSVGLKKFELNYATYTMKVSDAANMDVVITDAKASTLCAPVELTIPKKVKAYTLTYEGNNTLKAVEVTTTTIPANTPVLLNADADTYSFAVGVVASQIGTDKTYTKDNTEKKYMKTVSAGNLHGVFQEKYAPKYSYVLQNGANGVGFYQVNVTDYPINAFRCYVKLSESNARSLSIVFPETTGIEEVKTASAKSVKKMVDGRLVIEKNGNTFNAAGQIIK